MEMLGYNQYQKLASRTQNKELTDQERFLHSALGLCAEIEELRLAKESGDAAVIEDESGDVLWMMAEMCDACSLNMNTVFSSAAEGMQHAEKERASLYQPEANPPMPRKRHFDLALMAHCAANISGIAQKTLQGHTAASIDVEMWLQLIMVCLKRVASYHGFSVRHAMYQNIEKLKMRYPEGFSADKSIHRAE